LLSLPTFHPFIIRALTICGLPFLLNPAHARCEFRYWQSAATSIHIVPLQPVDVGRTTPF
jgi:hypothetical protein